MELHQMAEKAWVRTFENYLHTAHNVGKVTDVREALQGIIDHVNKSAGQNLFHVKDPEKDCRYFDVQLGDCHIATFFKNVSMFEASVMPEITPSIFDTVDTFIHNAIKYMNLVHSHSAIKRSIEPFVKQIEVNRDNVSKSVATLLAICKPRL